METNRFCRYCGMEIDGGDVCLDAECLSKHLFHNRDISLEAWCSLLSRGKHGTGIKVSK